MNKMSLWKPIKILLIFVVVCSAKLNAHEIRPAYLQIRESADHRVRVLWKQPVLGDVAIRLVPELSSGWLGERPSGIEATSSFLVKSWININGVNTPLNKQILTIKGLESTITDVLVCIEWADGKSGQTILKPQHPFMTLEEESHQPLAVPQYLLLGIEHILSGFDHLLFVLGLLLLVKGNLKLFKTITAFTIAHSITLAFAALGFIHVFPPVIESVIALSILFLAVELVRSQRGLDSFAIRFPWVIAFIFGLLHGFGFAGALASIGLPSNAIPLSLLLFNAGVEIGQILFVSAVLILIYLGRKIPVKLPSWSRLVAPYSIGSLAAFWFIQRLLVFL